MRTRYGPTIAIAAVIVLVTACGSDGTASDPTGTAEPSSEPVTLRLGYFPNVTHAPAIIGVEEGVLVDSLGDKVELELETFNSGTEDFLGACSTSARGRRLRDGVVGLDLHQQILGDDA